MNASFSFSDPDSAITALAAQLIPVQETMPVDQPIGRVLAQPILADRDSPAADVSAMDGYAIRLQDLKLDQDVPISGESKAGAAPPKMTDDSVVRIFTGAIIPEGCEAVVKREDTVESDHSIQFRKAAIESTNAGSHIRRRGENAAAGSDVLSSGIQITSAVMAGLANFGVTQPVCFRPIRVAVLSTGDEVVDPSTITLKPWQLRNSNQSAIVAMLNQSPLVDINVVQHVADDPSSLTESLNSALQSCDAVLMSGGVSKGDYDYVPETIQNLGGNIVFHGLPIRPGKPILGAATESGKLIIGLPGNPVSATINCHRFALPLLRRIGGVADWSDRPSVVTLSSPPSRPIPLHTMPLVQCRETGAAELVAAKGSGDLVALAKSDGYLSISPSSTEVGPWPLYRW